MIVTSALLVLAAAGYGAAGPTQRVPRAAADTPITATVKGDLRRAPGADAGRSAFRVTAGNITWEVDVAADAGLLQSGEKLVDSVAVVSGSYAESGGRAGLRRVLAARSIDAPGDDPRPAFIDVTIRGRLSTGMVAIGGETTGVTIAADGVRWELDISPRQQSLLRELNGRRVLVSGELTSRRGVELPNRYVVRVERLEPMREEP